MHIFSRVVFVVAMTVCLGAQAELVNIEDAIEASDINVSIKSSGKGHVNAKSCHGCKSVRLKVTPETIITVNGKSLPPGTELKQHWAGGVVIYNIKSRKVVRLDL